MLPDYQDIKDAAGNKTPVWYDGNGVPRYAPFHPHMLGVYDQFALLMEIQCQSCNRKFLVGRGWQRHEVRFANGHTEVITHTLRDLAETWGYGDPPRHGCIGDTMGCIPQRIVQAWHQTHETEDKPGVGRVITKWNDFARDPEIEGLNIQ